MDTLKKNAPVLVLVLLIGLVAGLAMERFWLSGHSFWGYEPQAPSACREADKGLNKNSGSKTVIDGVIEKVDAASKAVTVKAFRVSSIADDSSFQDLKGENLIIKTDGNTTLSRFNKADGKSALIKFSDVKAGDNAAIVISQDLASFSKENLTAEGIKIIQL